MELDRRSSDALKHIAVEMAAQTLRYSHWRLPVTKIVFLHEEKCPACALARATSNGIHERRAVRWWLKLTTYLRARGHALRHVESV